MHDVSNALREKARELLTGGEVGVVIGHGVEPGTSDPTVVFVRRPEDADKLVFNETCFRNPVVYLNKSEVKKLGKVGIVVKGCDMKALNVLLREKQWERDQLYVIGVNCAGVGEPRAAKCGPCTVHNPEGCDLVLGEPVTAKPTADPKAEMLAELEAMSPDERWEFWHKQLEKCIRCYACRQVCALCYCQRCVVEKNVPQWVETSPHVRGNFSWQTVRSFHLAGRCVGCDECERVCPVDIPLGLLNRKMAKEVKEHFDFVSGGSSDAKGPFSAYNLEKDTDEGIL